MANFNIKNKAESIDIDLFGSVGESWWGDSITVDAVKQTLNENKGKNVNIRLNSLGGSFFDALTIHDILKMHKGTVDVDMIGANASASTIISMAATNKPRISKSGLFLIHNTLADSGYETAKAKRKAAEEMEKMDGIINKMFSEKTGQSEKFIAELLAADKWINAEEAKEYGFVDEIFEPQKTDNLKNQITNINNSYLPKIVNTMADTKEVQEQSTESFINSITEFFKNKKVDVSNDTVKGYENKITELTEARNSADAKVTEIENAAKEAKAEFESKINSLEADNAKLKETHEAANVANSAKVQELTNEVEELKSELNKLGVTETPKNEQDKDKTEKPDAWANIAKKMGGIQ